MYKTMFRVVFISLLATSILTGCATLNLKKAIRAGEPLPEWEKQLLAYYSRTVPGDGPPKLQFIHDYEQKFPQLSGDYICRRSAAFKELDYLHYARFRKMRLIRDQQIQQQDVQVKEKAGKPCRT